MVDPDIRRARTLPPEVYRDPAWFARLRDGVLARTWHVVAEVAEVAAPGSVLPVTLLPGCLDEPLLLVRDEAGTLRAFANVCTHRGALLVEAPCQTRALRCPYHGRRFDLAGRMTHMPGMEEAVDFPGPDDDLPEVSVASLGPLVLVSLDPVAPLDAMVDDVRPHLGALPLHALAPDPDGTRDYLLEASWLLWCDNYLEGFHVPFVHPGLARSLDVRGYRTRLFPWASVQVGPAVEGEPAFDLEPEHPEHGTRVAGLYVGLFPTTMLNLYPWGLSLNVVRPEGPDRTRVHYRRYLWGADGPGHGAGSDLDRVEHEDDVIVERTWRGVRSRLARRGRYAPGHEAGVHHFHRLLVRLARGS